MVVGMKHCGSTMIFNLLRIAYKAQGHDVSFVDKRHAVPSKQISEDTKYVVPIRDPRDIAISGFLRFMYKTSLNGPCTDPVAEITKFGLFTFINYMEENILLAYDAMVMPSTHLFRYEDLKANPVQETLRLFAYVGLPTDDEGLVAAALHETDTYFDRADLTNDLHEYHRRTAAQGSETCKDILLTRDHNTSGGQSKKYETFFTEAMNVEILENPIVRHFLDKFGYLS